MNIEYIWPECFQTGVVDPEREDAALCADGLRAWGICIAGSHPPDCFGAVMVQIADRLGCSATPERLRQWAKEHWF